jgi:hypothetical protein
MSFCSFKQACVVRHGKSKTIDPEKIVVGGLNLFFFENLKEKKHKSMFKIKLRYC